MAVGVLGGRQGGRVRRGATRCDPLVSRPWAPMRASPPPRKSAHRSGSTSVTRARPWIATVVAETGTVAPEADTVIAARVPGAGRRVSANATSGVAPVYITP